MAFLFKSKKNLEKAPSQIKGDGPSGVVSSQASLQSANGRSGRDEKIEKSTPGSSLNNSLNSLGGNQTPSPEQINGRRGPNSEQSSDLPVSLNRHTLLNRYLLLVASEPSLVISNY
jgi:hypothetical protein